jgi:hypothetical protein
MGPSLFKGTIIVGQMEWDANEAALLSYAAGSGADIESGPNGDNGHHGAEGR